MGFNNTQQNILLKLIEKCDISRYEQNEVINGYQQTLQKTLKEYIIERRKKTVSIART